MAGSKTNIIVEKVEEKEEKRETSRLGLFLVLIGYLVLIKKNIILIIPGTVTGFSSFLF